MTTQCLALSAPRRVLYSGKGFGETTTKPETKRAPASDEKDSKQQDIFAKYGMQAAEQPPKLAPEPEFNLISVVPPAVQIGLERFLIGGIVILLVAFLGIGIGITYEAFAAARGEPLPEDQQRLIVDVLEPKFTPILFAGFACSISLGGLKTLQLGGGDVQYKEAAYSEEDD